jgi:DNA primase
MVRRFGSFLQLQEWDKYVDKIDISKFDDIFFEEKREKIEQKLSLPESFISLTNSKLPQTAITASRYLKSRGITKEDIIRWKIGYCLEGEYANRIIVPSFGKSGYVNYFVARSYVNSGYRYKNPPASRDMVFNQLYVDWDDDLVIVEGVFDAIVAGPNAVPILGSNLRENSVLFQEIVKHDTPIYVALDPDMEKKALKLINKMLAYGVELYKVEISPYDDVGEMTKEEFQNRKKHSAPFDSESYLLHRMINSLQI